MKGNWCVFSWWRSVAIGFQYSHLGNTHTSLLPPLVLARHTFSCKKKNLVNAVIRYHGHRPHYRNPNRRIFSSNSRFVFSSVKGLCFLQSRLTQQISFKIVNSIALWCACKKRQRAQDFRFQKHIGWASELFVVKLTLRLKPGAKKTSVAPFLIYFFAIIPTHSSEISCSWKEGESEEGRITLALRSNGWRKFIALVGVHVQYGTRKKWSREARVPQLRVKSCCSAH